MLLELTSGLVHERDAVREKEHSLGPVGSHEHIGQCDHRARLAAASCHHEECLAFVSRLEALGDLRHGLHLVMPTSDGGVDARARRTA